MELGITKMKEKLLIVGAGGFGKVVFEHAIKDYECVLLMMVLKQVKAFADVRLWEIPRMCNSCLPHIKNS